MIQGYQMTDLERGMVYADILRARWGTDKRFAPLASAGGATCWGVPLNAEEIEAMRALLRRWGASDLVKARLLPVVVTP